MSMEEILQNLNLQTSELAQNLVKLSERENSHFWWYSVATQVLGEARLKCLTVPLIAFPVYFFN